MVAYCILTRFGFYSMDFSLQTEMIIREKRKRTLEGWRYIISLTEAPVIEIFWHVKSVIKVAIKTMRIPRWRIGRWKSKA